MTREVYIPENEDGTADAYVHFKRKNKDRIKKEKVEDN